ncbi:MAG: hypothetical protein Hens3KO_05450 [Henriciella sp.]
MSNGSCALKNIDPTTEDLFNEAHIVLKYGIVGLSAALIYAIVSVVIVYFNLATPAYANLIGFGAGFVFSAYAHLYYTFLVETDRLRAVLRYALVTLSALCLSYFGLSFFDQAIGLNKVSSQMGAVGVSSFWSFLLSRLWAF